MGDRNDKRKRLLFSELQVLLKAGLSFSRAFSLIVEGSKDKDRELYGRIFDNVVGGSELWSALKKEPLFDALDYGVVRIGEETGHLPEALSFLVDYYQRREDQRRKLLNSLSYPAITFCMAVVVLVFMMLVVVPMFEQVYSRMGGELPGLTKAIVGFSRAAPALLACMVFVVLAFAIFRYINKDRSVYKAFESSFILGLPGVGGIVRKFHVSRLCRILHLLVASEVPLLQSLGLVEEIILFHPYNKAIRRVVSGIERGESMSEGFSEHPELFDRKFLVLMRVGEETNALDNMLGTLADDTSAELDYQIRQLNTVAEPVLILFIGLIVAFVLISMYLPMFKLGMTIS
ncbi:MAG: type II secretion system F family protein [Bacteroidales bacterium]|nr:type II secretion system F family protein [Bacteroidales bacterium]